MSTDVKPKGGLEDVVAASSAICYLDGDRGVLAYYGYDIHDLARGATFEEVCYLLWHGRLPNRAELGDLQSQLAAARPAVRTGLATDAPAAAVGRHGRAADPDVRARPLRSRGLRQLAASQLPEGRSPDRSAVEPRRHLRPASGGRRDPSSRIRRSAMPPTFSTCSRGTGRSALATRAFDIALVLHADHELNASTFAARVAAATLTDMHSAIVAAIGTLKGPLHGGANADVMRLLIEIGEDATPERVDEAIRGKLARKVKIPGFGHRVYRTEDPRATHLRRMSKDLGERAGNTRWFEMSQRIEKLVTGEKKLYPNVDFYSASTYYTLGIPIDLFTPIFAVSRISGWTAHCLEQYANNRLIRPRTDYIGPHVSADVPAAGAAVTAGGDGGTETGDGGNGTSFNSETRRNGGCKPRAPMPPRLRGERSTDTREHKPPYSGHVACVLG